MNHPRARRVIRIQITSRGGFTGLPSAREVDVDSLNEAQQRRVRDLVQREFWNAPTVQRCAHPRPHDFEYTVTVEDGDRKKTIVLHKAATSDALRELVDLLEAKGSGPA